jgi:hypothetical protein
MNIRVSEHAVERYIERVKPTFNLKTARAEIERLLEGQEPVPYVEYVHRREMFDAFIELAPGICLCLRHLSSDTMEAITTTIRTGATPAERQRKRKEKRERKRRSQAQKNRERFARREGRAKPEE